ncbi:heterokaryon incompatibility protein-domain-containing protein [Paraphoma chrysanthemicola]|uniref:Heterokaryon incompatibility protein-domain-containing protein n=1 Tax=Paraphoma chrysanthemicola TaxID=798071 RepID=A0A8K0VS23_9PLEO|nr:heterokaryon incompatibility protein-domain-containing protein [Paraphoma chrysanthemicola]
MSSYQYAKLASRTHFRLMKLDPSSKLDNPDQAERCFKFSLHVVDMKDAPPYETVSYVWGDGPQCIRLAVGEPSHGYLLISQLLMLSLRRLQRVMQTAYLWIDQICINQTCTTEKNHQVQLMADIYKHCTRVIIHLAPEIYPRNIKGLSWNEGSFRFVETEDNISFQTLVSELNNIRAQQSAGYNPLLPMIEPLMMACVYLICQHPWFFRGWVIQEVALAPDATMLMADEEVTLDLFISLIHDTTSDEGPYFLKSLRHRLGFMDASLGHRRFQRLLRLQQSRNPLMILDTASAGSKFRLTQDHIFGFLGLMAVNIRPDYNLAWEQVFVETAHRIIASKGGLQILMHLHRDVRCDEQIIDMTFRARVRTLPSWVPCWTDPRAQHRIWANQTASPISSACINRRHVSEQISYPPWLHTRGGCIGHVQKTQTSWSSNAKYDNAIIFMKAMFAHVRIQEIMDPHISAGKLMSDIFIVLEAHMLCGWFELLEVFSGPYEGARHEYDAHGSQRFPHEFSRTRDMFGTYVERVHAMKPADVSSIRQQIESLEYFVQRDTAIVMQDGRQGSAKGRKTIMSGDLVCILHGLHCPVVLRPYPASVIPFDSGDRIIYMVIDVCEIEGCMNGEAVDWKENEAQTFILL